MRSRLLVAIGLSVALAACAPATPPVDVAAETEALRAAAEAYNAAANGLDAAALASFYAPDARSMPPNEPTLSSAEAMEAFAAELSMVDGFTVALESPDVFVGSGGDVGYTVGLGRFTFPGPDGEMMTTEERDVHVWRKQADGTWKIVLDIWNSATPLPGSGG